MGMAMAGVGLGLRPQLVSSALLPARARKSGQRWKWICSPSPLHPLPSSSATRLHFHYPPISLSASLNPPPPPHPSFTPPTKLYVSGLSFRTTEESLRNAFEQFGQLTEVNLVMDKIANRPRGFAFLRYSTEEEARKAIDGMHGKFLHGRVIFVEVAKPRSQLGSTTQKP